MPTLSSNMSIFKNAPQGFNVDAFVAAANLSPTLVAQLWQYENAVTGGSAQAIQFGIDGAASFDPNRQFVYLGMDRYSGSDALAQQLADVAHEIGHFVDRNRYVTTFQQSENVGQQVLTCLTTEGYAVVNNYVVAEEIKTNSNNTINVSLMGEGWQVGGITNGYPGLTSFIYSMFEEAAQILDPTLTQQQVIDTIAYGIGFRYGVNLTSLTGRNYFDYCRDAAEGRFGGSNEPPVDPGSVPVHQDGMGGSYVFEFDQASSNQTLKFDTFMFDPQNNLLEISRSNGDVVEDGVASFRLDGTTIVRWGTGQQEHVSIYIGTQEIEATPANDGSPTTNLIAVTTNTTQTPTQSGISDPTTGGASGIDSNMLVDTSIYEIGGLGNVNTATGNYAYANNMLTGGLRPGAQSLTTEILGSQLAESFRTNPDLAQSLVWAPEVKAAALQMLATGVETTVPTDPLILDLNGDGVKLTSFADAPVLFDIDHDGGSKEVTGWVSAEDGIVVMDLNGNGQIDGIHETMSEYFNGEVGAGGTAGTKPYANGFAALKSLDSNSDNQFTSADTAFTNVKVWIDANHDGKTDTGELKTFDELGITSINLTPTIQSGLVNGGNEVLATGTFTQGGLTKEAQAARFIANPTGNTATVDATGTTVSAQDGQSTYVSSITTGETIDVAALGVKNAYGNIGNDTLIGSADANWLVGGQGSDTLNAGAGDDMLIIDAADLQQNIHAGEGFDMVQVVGTEGVTLNLAQAEIEVAVGGTGDDILIGGGRSSIFIRANDGDDIVIGGAANDALSGENGFDLIDGGAGNDIIRGGRGQDQLMGGVGDDLVFAGQDDDRLSGGAGNDVLRGEQGDDVIDGGDGIDIAEFSGSFSDYRITKLTDSAYRVVDTKAGRDGADMLTGVEKLNFADVSAVDITLDNPLPVKDVLTIADRVGLKLIKVADLLANDRDWQGDALHITTISDVKGGTLVGSYNSSTQEWTPTLTANNELQFTPDPAYTGVMSFKYKLADADGTPGATAFIAGTQIAAEMRGQVFIKTPDMPTDGLFTDQWYLNDINVLPVWKDAYGQGYTGKNVKIAQFEPGMPFSTGPEVFDYRHADLQGNVDPAWIADPNGAIPQSFSQHATLVAGVMTAARNGEGAVGVAYDAKLSGHYIQGTGLEIPALEAEITAALAQFKNYDVVNNSWGSTADFDINVVPVGTVQQGILDAVTLGRGGLGTAVVMAGGNDRAKGGNTNANALTANRAVIVTGAINAQADISTLTIGQAPFSNPGASILVSAPGSNVASTSRILMGDDGTIFGNDTSTTQGTSFATPIVSGIVALMLEANPKLGWRDVQQILALTARQVNDPNTDNTYNSASNWNGGGMHTSHDYGFGDVDARAAVRLAESWVSTRTSYNERHLGSGEGSMNGAANLGITINDGAVITRTLSLGAGLRAEHATVSLDVTHSNWGDLTVELISPTGTISKLIANPGSSATNPDGDVGTGQLTFALDTTHDYGENAQGNWQLRITDRSGRGTGTLNGWKVDVYGSDLNETNPGLDTAGSTPLISATGNNQYFYTDEFGGTPGASRATLTDGNGGADIFNATAVSSGSTINLNNGSASTIAGRSLTINGDVEHAFGGDGNDILTGNALSNRLSGGRGNDNLNGGAALDFLDGGAGDDTLTGGSESDFFVIRKAVGSIDTIVDFTPTAVGEKILLVGFENIVDFSQVSVTQEGANTRLGLGNGQSVVLQNVAPTQISEQNFSFFSDDAMLEDYASYTANAAVWSGTSGVENTLLPNAYGDLRAFALGGNDVIGGQTKNDLIDGGDGNDTVWGDYPGYAPIPGSDWLEGGAGSDVLYGGGADDAMFGGSGNDNLQGEAGNDMLLGGTGADYLAGGDGNDLIALEGDFGTVNGTIYSYYGTRVGGAGADIFKVTTNGGGNSGFSASGTQFSAYNLIADFDPTQSGEVIDLTALKWVRGFGDLSIQTMIINGTAVARITATDGTNQLAINLRGVSGNALTAGHFKINPNPGLIIGTAYSDTLTGDAGGNTLDGGAGVDAMTGRTGDDTYIVDNAGDTVIELPDGGFDTIKSSVSYTLPANVENLVLTGTAAINGTGNDASNRIVGNAAANLLDGKGGVDALLGGAGNDTYVVDSQADTVVEYVGDGMDTVQSLVSYTLGNNIENLTLTGTDAINATGNDLANALTGNAGDNILDGAAGADTMAGGTGDDTYLVDDVGDVVAESVSEGIDTVYSTVNYSLGADVENLVLATGAASGSGNALDNALTGNSAGNTLNGGAGNDMLDGGTGADALLGGTGDDTYVVDNTSDVVTELAGEGSDTVVASVSFDLSTRPDVENVVLTGTTNLNAIGNAADNRLVGNAGANALSGGAGNDTLDGGAEADALAGGTGDDTYMVDNIGDTVTENVGEGVDTVRASVDATLGANVENLVLTGFGSISGMGNGLGNALTGNAGNNTLTGADGYDTLDGGAGADTLIGGTGDDTYVVDNAGDGVIEAADGGIDTIRASVGIDLAALPDVESAVLTGTANLSATGNAGANRLEGNTGNNTLDGGAGADTLIGGLGDDTYIVDRIDDVVVENAGEGTDAVNSSISYTLGTNLENLTLTGASVIDATGNELSNALVGNSAANTLSGGLGNDTLIGGLGDDTYIVDNAGDVVVESAGEGTDTVNSSIGYTLAANVENLRLAGTAAIDGTGNALNNVLTGNTASNTLSGGDGSDTLNGAAGADTLIGGMGNDTYTVDNVGDVIIENPGEGVDNVSATCSYTLGENVENLSIAGVPGLVGTGNSLDNNLSGGWYNQALFGLAGNDTLSGGDGDDTLDGGMGNDLLQGGGGNDTYKFARDGGADVVYDDYRYRSGGKRSNWVQGNGGADTLRLGADIGLADLELEQSGANLVVGLRSSGITGIAGQMADRMTLQSWSNSYNKIETIEFADGTQHQTTNWLIGTAADDTLTAGAFYARLFGGSGNDVLNGDAGTDWLDGGAGADTLIGGAGSDTYLFGRGSGGDMLAENDATAGNLDTMSVMAGVATDQLWFRHVGDNLEISVIGTLDTATIQNWYFGSAQHIEQFRTTDGKLLLDSQVENLVQAMAAFSPPASGQTTLPPTYQTALAPVLAANWQ